MDDKTIDAPGSLMLFPVSLFFLRFLLSLYRNRYSSFIYVSVRLSYGDLPKLTSVHKQIIKSIKSPLVLFFSHVSPPRCIVSKCLFLLIFWRILVNYVYYTKGAANRAIFTYYYVVDLHGKHRANDRVWSMKTENAPNCPTRLRQSHY